MPYFSVSTEAIQDEGCHLPAYPRVYFARWLREMQPWMLRFLIVRMPEGHHASLRLAV